MSEEKMRASFETWVRKDKSFHWRWLDRIDGDPDYCAGDIQRLWEAWQAALRTHEKESEAVAEVMGTETNMYIGVANLDNLSRLPAGTKLYPAPPSATAIETAAIMRAMKVVDGWASTASEYGFDGDMEQFMRVKADIEALIPQDGRTQLEEFGMKVAESIRYRVSDGRNVEPDDFRAIVTNLIGEKK